MAATAADTRGDDDAADTMKILLATDTHLGYMEKDAIRGNDSLVTFEEVLQLAHEHDVDCVLLGGDLFHDNKPSRRTLHGCVSLLRKYCLGDKPCQVEFLSDQSVNFGHTSFPTVNYEDPNLNVSCPIFSIHGNHDDPAGQGNLCSLDILSAAGLVNYFGKTTSLERIEMSPLLLQKGQTKLALYGLGAMRDERLHRLFVHKNVSMLRPREQRDDWFNLLVLHQNRSKHSATSYIPEQFLDAFLDLVFWGHEHECKIEPAWVGDQSFYVTQPGSSIATSLSEGETQRKHVGVLSIRHRDFRLRKVALQTVRPFIADSIVLSETQLSADDPEVASKVEAYCAERVESMIDRAARERGTNSRQPELPLIRLRVDYSGGYDLFSIHRFGQKFVEKVANPKDIVLFHRRKMTNALKLDHTDGEVLPELKSEVLDSTRVEDMVREYFTAVDKAQKLSLLSEKGMREAVKEFVDKEERDAIGELFKHQLGKSQEHLKRRNACEDSIEAELERYAGERQAGQGDQLDGFPCGLLKKSSSSSNHSSRVIADDPVMDNGESSDSGDSTKVTQGRGRGRGRGTRGKAGRGRKAAVVEELPVPKTSIRDAFNSQRSRRAVKRSPLSVISSDDEITIKSDDDNETDSLFGEVPTAKKRKQLNSTQSSGRKGVSFNDSDNDDDEFSMPPARKGRR